MRLENINCARVVEGMSNVWTESLPSTLVTWSSWWPPEGNDDKLSKSQWMLRGREIWRIPILNCSRERGVHRSGTPPACHEAFFLPGQ